MADQHGVGAALLMLAGAMALWGLIFGASFALTAFSPPIAPLVDLSATR